jgi:hypothetical protein
MTTYWRPAQIGHLAALQDLDAQRNAPIPLRIEHVPLFPRACWVLCTLDNQIVGYCLTHPWMVHDCPAPGAPVTASVRANALHVQHFYLDPRAQDRRTVQQLFFHLRAAARHDALSFISAIAFAHTARLWQHASLLPGPHQTSARTRYGVGALYMLRDLREGSSSLSPVAAAC